MDQKLHETTPAPPAEGFYSPQRYYAADVAQPTQTTAPAPGSAPAPIANTTVPIVNVSQPEAMHQATKRPVPDVPPAYPPRPTDLPSTTAFPPPPTRKPSSFGSDDLSNPVHYVRDPHKLIAYLVPFPKPEMHKHLFHQADAKDIPERFLIYTPPPPPLKAPAEGEKEAKFQKVQRKWQEEVRAAKADNSKVASWKGLKSRATKGINEAMGWTTNSNLDFLNRVPGAKPSKSREPSPDHHAEDGVQEDEETKKTVGLEEMVLIYPSTIPGTQEQIREEFVNTMLRSKSKAQKDSIIATGLLPVSFAVDVLATLVWPFGGLLEIDSVWLYSSIRGAKTARSVTKRLNSSSPTDAPQDEAKLKLTFTASQRLDILQSYLQVECHKKDPKLFKSAGPAPTETQVLEAIGWSPSQTGETKNWEDEQWEVAEVKEDLKATMHKGAKEWDKWCKNFEKNPEKALKK